MSNRVWTIEDIKPGFAYITDSGSIAIVVSYPEPSDWKGYLTKKEIERCREEGITFQHGVRVYFANKLEYVENVGVERLLVAANNGTLEILSEGD